jgi:hypothetical protein
MSTCLSITQICLICTFVLSWFIMIGEIGEESMPLPLFGVIALIWLIFIYFVFRSDYRNGYIKAPKVLRRAFRRPPQGPNHGKIAHIPEIFLVDIFHENRGQAKNSTLSDRRH